MDLFQSPAESHAHSLGTLNLLNQYDEFMDGLTTICDMGCGHGHDLIWWANCTYEDDRGKTLPRNYKCLGIDNRPLINIGELPKNARYLNGDFEDYTLSVKADLLWSHDSFRYAVNPLQTLKHWNEQLNENAAIFLIVPQTVNIVYNKPSVRTFSGNYYSYNVTNLMYMLATSGFDCSDGMFMKHADDPWIHCMAYKTNIPPFDPKTTTWYTLAEHNLLPKSAVESIKKWGFVKQEDLVTTWLDKRIILWSQV